MMLVNRFFKLTFFVIFIINICALVVIVVWGNATARVFIDEHVKIQEFKDVLNDAVIKDVRDLDNTIRNSARLENIQAIMLQRKMSKQEVEDFFIFHDKSLLKQVSNIETAKSLMCFYKDYDSTLVFDDVLSLYCESRPYILPEYYLFKDGILVDVVDGGNLLRDTIYSNIRLYILSDESFPSYFEFKHRNNSIVCFDNLYCHRYNDYAVYCTEDSAVFSVCFKEAIGYVDKFYIVDKENIIDNYKHLHDFAEKIRKSPSKYKEYNYK
ncbi:MAG: hypothetical protein MJZ13_02975 [Bacteroidales bacterium]|nr:hypothetical protein [Bacteroidales bacterium]